ncbi:T9SS type A sorting domain-containing protein [candidate division KSB1 bacterium]
MKRYSIVFSFLSVIIVLAAVLYVTDQFRITVFPPSVPSETGTEDDPYARVMYEWKKTRSPLSESIPEKIRAKELKFAENLPTKEEFAAARVNKGSNSQIYTWERRGVYEYGGRTRALAVDVSDENVILAGGVSGGMWRGVTTDNFANIAWAKTTTNSQLHSVTSIIQDTRAGKTDTWYYGTGEYRGNSASGDGASYYGNGIYKSTDGGNTWNLLVNTSTLGQHRFDQIFDFVWNLAVDVSNTSEDEIYAATYGGINRSVDGGTTWTSVLGDLYSGTGYTDIAITSTGVVYAAFDDYGSYKGIYRSVDGLLNNWTDITPAGWPAVYDRTVIGIAPSDEDIVYFIAETEGYGLNDHSIWKYKYLSGDGTGSGGVWEDRSSRLPADGGQTGDFDSQNSYDLVIKVSQSDTNTVMIGGKNLYRSTDGFASNSNTTWIGGYTSSNNSYNSYTNQHPDQHAMAFFPSSSDWLLAGHDGGISLTRDYTNSTVSWELLNEGYNTLQFYTVAIDKSTAGNDVIIGGMQDNGTTYISSAASNPFEWYEVYGGDGSFCAISENRQYYYISSQNGNIYRWTLNDDGNVTSWTKVAPAGSDYLFINPFILNPSDSKMMFLPRGNELLRSTDLTLFPPSENSVDEGTYWDNLLNSKMGTGVDILSLGMSTASPANRLYFGSDDGKIYKLDNANTGDPVPVDVTSNDFPSNGYPASISVDPTNGDKVMVCFSNYEVKSIFYSENGGTSWTDVSGNLEEFVSSTYTPTGNGPSVRWVTIHPVGTGTTYFAGTSIGLYSTETLNGQSTVWVQEGADVIGNVVVDMIDNRISDGFVAVATHGAGIFTSTVVTAVAEDDKQLPEEYELEQNFPNPFNPVTKINFNLAVSGTVHITVFNSSGQRVRSLVNGENYVKGKHSIIFDARNDYGEQLATGVYFYSIHAGDFKMVKRMTLIK